MRYFSLDTNFVLALINKNDRLHKTAVRIIQKEEKDCALCFSVIREARKVAREKINQAVVNSLEIIVDIRGVTDKDKRKKELKRRFQRLMQTDAPLKNFYLFLQERIVSYIARIGVQTLPTYLSNLSEHVARTLEPELNKIIPYTTMKIKYKNSAVVEKISDIKSSSSTVHFKDTIDYQIFCEIVINLSSMFMIDFYTDDTEFAKKGKDAYQLLEKKLRYDPCWLQFVYHKIDT